MSNDATNLSPSTAYFKNVIDKDSTQNQEMFKIWIDSVKVEFEDNLKYLTDALDRFHEEEDTFIEDLTFGKTRINSNKSKTKQIQKKCSLKYASKFGQKTCFYKESNVHSFILMD